MQGNVDDCRWFMATKLKYSWGGDNANSGSGAAQCTLIVLIIIITSGGGSYKCDSIAICTPHSGNECSCAVWMGGECLCDKPIDPIQGKTSGWLFVWAILYGADGEGCSLVELTRSKRSGRSLREKDWAAATAKRRRVQTFAVCNKWRSRPRERACRQPVMIVTLRLSS